MRLLAEGWHSTAAGVVWWGKRSSCRATMQLRAGQRAEGDCGSRWGLRYSQCWAAAGRALAPPSPPKLRRVHRRYRTGTVIDWDIALLFLSEPSTKARVNLPGFVGELLTHGSWLHLQRHLARLPLGCSRAGEGPTAAALTLQSHALAPSRAMPTDLPPNTQPAPAVLLQPSPCCRCLASRPSWLWAGARTASLVTLAWTSCKRCVDVCRGWMGL